MRLIKRLIKKFIMPDMPPEVYNRKDRRTQLRYWENRQRKRDRFRTKGRGV